MTEMEQAINVIQSLATQLGAVIPYMSAHPTIKKTSEELARAGLLMAGSLKITEAQRQTREKYSISSPEATTEELSIFLQSWFCGCGGPSEAAECLLRLLEAHPLHSKRDIDSFLSPMMKMLIYYTLDHFGLTEHGGSVGGAWLSKKGLAVMLALRRESTDEFQNLFQMRCVHGTKMDADGCSECASEATTNSISRKPHDSSAG